MPATRPSSKMAPLGQTRRDFQGYHFFALSRKKALLKRLKKKHRKVIVLFFYPPGAKTLLVSRRHFLSSAMSELRTA